MRAASRNCATRSLVEIVGPAAAGWPGVRVTGVQLDSRRVSPGNLFLAVPGAAHDGREFIGQAIASGAAAVVAEPPATGLVAAASVPVIELPDLVHAAGFIAARYHGQPSHAMHMVGVTGTNGKTTTSRLLAQLGRTLGHRCGTIGTLGASLDEGVVEAANTTPDAVELQQRLADWRDAGVTWVSMEVSSHALTQGRVNGVRFDTAVFTNLSRDHLDYHRTMAAYARAKAALFQSEGLRHAVINLDDPYAAPLLKTLPKSLVTLTYSVRPDTDADVHVEALRVEDAQVIATVQTPWGKGELRTALAGAFNLANLAAVITCAAIAGAELPAVLAAISRLRAVPGRMQTIANPLGLRLIVDYAHTPDALEQVLVALRPQVSGRLLCVFGCGGDRDPGKRADMGRIACKHADVVIVTSDNPRSEPPLRIMEDIAAGCNGAQRMLVDRAIAITTAVAEAAAGDCVLVAGKGHEDYQIIAGERLPFSDAIHLQDAAAERDRP